MSGATDVHGHGLVRAGAADSDYLKDEAGYVHLGTLDDSLGSIGDDSLDMGERPLAGSAVAGGPERLEVSAVAPGLDDMERRLEKRFIAMTDKIWQKMLSTEERLAATSSDVERVKRTLRDGPTQGHAQAGREGAPGASEEQLQDLQSAIDALGKKHEELKSNAAAQQKEFVAESLALKQRIEKLDENMRKVSEDADRFQSQLPEKRHEDMRSAATAAAETARSVSAESEERIAKHIDDALASFRSEHMSAIESAVSRAMLTAEESVDRNLEERLAGLRAEQQAAVEAAADAAAKATRATSLAAEEAAAKNLDEALQDFRIELDSLHVEQDQRRAEQDQMFERLRSEFIPAAADLAVGQLMTEITGLAAKLEPRVEDCEKTGFHLEQDVQNLQNLSTEHEDAMRKLSVQLNEHHVAQEGLNKHLRATQQQLGDLEIHTEKELTSLQEAVQVAAQSTHERELFGQRMAAGLEELQGVVDTLAREAMPSVLSRTGVLEKKLHEEVEALKAADAHTASQVVAQCNHEVKDQINRLANEMADRFKEERMNNRDEAVALERRLADTSERWQSKWGQRQEAAEHRQVLMDQRHGTHEQRHSLHEQRLASHDEALQRLAERCHEIPRLEAQVETVRTATKKEVESVRASTKDDLAASVQALTAFCGEVAAMTKGAQLGNAGAATQLRLPSVTSNPGYAWDGQSWRPSVPLMQPPIR